MLGGQQFSERNIMKSFSTGLLLLSLVLLSTIQDINGRRFGKGPGRRPGRPGRPYGKPGRPFGKPKPTENPLNKVWQQVEFLVPEVPPSEVTVECPLVKITPNASTSVGWMTERPVLKWKAERGALYTVMIIDGGIQALLPQVFLHWMVTNIPGNSVDLGNEVMEYVTPFSLEFNEDSSFITDRELSATL